MMADYTWEPWTFRDGESEMVDGGALTGFEVHATDGHIGKVDDASMEVGASQVVVDTGPWIFGRRVLLPAACIERIDWNGRGSMSIGPRTRSRAHPRSTKAPPGPTPRIATLSAPTGAARTAGGPRSE